MAWRRSGDKPLSEPMIISLPTHVCVTRPQWVKVASSAGNDSAHMQRHVICHCTTMSASEICNDENQGMKMLSASPTLCKGNPRATGGLYHKGPVMQNFDVFFIVGWNQLSNKQPYNITLATASLGDMPSSHAVSLRSLLICSTFQGSRTCLWFIMFCCVFIPTDFIHILQLLHCYSTVTLPIIRLPQCEWRYPDEYG